MDPLFHTFLDAVIHGAHASWDSLCLTEIRKRQPALAAFVILLATGLERENDDGCWVPSSHTHLHQQSVTGAADDGVGAMTSAPWTDNIFTLAQPTSPKSRPCENRPRRSHADLHPETIGCFLGATRFVARQDGGCERSEKWKRDDGQRAQNFKDEAPPHIDWQPLLSNASPAPYGPSTCPHSLESTVIHQRRQLPSE